MRLLYNDVSPFARKARIVALERGLSSLTFQSVDPLGEDVAELRRLNPLGKIPVLITSAGEVIVDSRNICEYLDGEGPAPSLFPVNPALRRDMLFRQAIADGLADIAVSLRMEMRRPASERSADWSERWQGAIERTIRKMRCSASVREPDLGDIATAVALLFVRHRLQQIDWRLYRPELAVWLDEMERRPSFQSTDLPGETRRTFPG